MTKKNILLVIDLQEQNRDALLHCETVKDFIRTHQHDYDEIIFTVFSQHSLDSDCEYHTGYHKYLDWDDCAECNTTDLMIDPVIGVDVNTRVLVKNTYAAKLPDDLKPDNCHIDIIGCDMDAGIMATAFKLWDEQWDFNIPINFVYTTAKNRNYLELKKIYKRNFGHLVI